MVLISKESSQSIALIPSASLYSLVAPPRAATSAPRHDSFFSQQCRARLQVISGPLSLHLSCILVLLLRCSMRCDARVQEPSWTQRPKVDLAAAVERAKDQASHAFGKCNVGLRRLPWTESHSSSFDSSSPVDSSNRRRKVPWRALRLAPPCRRRYRGERMVPPLRFPVS